MGEWTPQEKIVHEKVKNDPVTTHFIQRCPGVSAKYTDTEIPNISSFGSRAQKYRSG